MNKKGNKNSKTILLDEERVLNNILQCSDCGERVGETPKLPLLSRPIQGVLKAIIVGPLLDDPVDSLTPLLGLGWALTGMFDYTPYLRCKNNLIKVSEDYCILHTLNVLKIRDYAACIFLDRQAIDNYDPSVEPYTVGKAKNGLPLLFVSGKPFSEFDSIEFEKAGKYILDFMKNL